MAEERWCPRCGMLLKKRTAKKSGKTFLGCSGWKPDGSGCDYTDWGNKDYKKPVLTPASAPNWSPSEQQQAILDEFKSGADGRNVIITARAGTAKSSTLVYAAFKAIPKNCRTAMMAFNRKIANANEVALHGTGVTACTFHSAGNAACKANANSKFSEWKLRNYVVAALPERLDEKQKPVVSYVVGRMVSLCKNRLLEPTEENLDELAEMYSGLEVSTNRDVIYDMVPKVLAATLSDKDTIDHDDMLWHCYMNDYAMQTYSLLCTDEDQDLNPLRIALLRRICPTGRLALVGDTYQSIYGFSGADIFAVQTLEAMVNGESRGAVELPLTKTRRVPKVGVELVRQKGVVPDFECFSDAPMGEIRNASYGTAVSSIQVGDMVISRNSAPLIPLCYSLLRENKKVTIAGKEIGGGLVALVTRSKAATMSGFLKWLDKWSTEECEKVQGTRWAASRISFVEDQADCLKTFSENATSVDQLKKNIENIFSDTDETGMPKDEVLLSTIHKAKGLESDNIYHLQPELIPSKMATRPWEIQQEHHLEYVGDTRFKRTLTYVSGKDKK